jgi:hypothetical protein
MNIALRATVDYVSGLHWCSSPAAREDPPPAPSSRFKVAFTIAPGAQPARARRAKGGSPWGGGPAAAGRRCGDVAMLLLVSGDRDPLVRLGVRHPASPARCSGLSNAARSMAGARGDAPDAHAQHPQSACSFSYCSVSARPRGRGRASVKDGRGAEIA